MDNLEEPSQNYISLISSLKSVEDKRLIFSILCCIIQKYVWCCGTDGLLRTIPASIGLPLIKISQELRMIPFINYAAVFLYNWNLKDNSMPISPENLRLNYKLVNNSGFEWFVCIHIAIEANGGVLEEMLKIKEQLTLSDVDGVPSPMLLDNMNKELKNLLVKITQTLRVWVGGSPMGSLPDPNVDSYQRFISKDL